MPARLPALLAAPPPGPTPLWLTNARLLDGTGAPPREGASVLVRDGRIELVAGAADAPPGDASAIDLEGRTLMPGLVDAHAHVKAKLPQPDEGAEPLLPGTSAHVVAAHLAEALRRGVTTVRDVGSFGSDGRRGAPGDAARRVPRAPPADLRADRLRDEPGRAVLLRDVPRGRRPGRHPPRRARAAPPRRGLHQADDDRRALGRARGSGSRAGDRRGGRGARRGGAPARLPGGRARRGAARHRARDRRRASTRSSTACTSTSGPTCSSAWPSRGRCSCRRSRASTASPGSASEERRGARDVEPAAGRARAAQPRAGRPHAARGARAPG